MSITTVKKNLLNISIGTVHRRDTVFNLDQHGASKGIVSRPSVYDCRFGPQGARIGHNNDLDNMVRQP